MPQKTEKTHLQGTKVIVMDYGGGNGKAAGEAMKRKYGDRLERSIYTADSKVAKHYHFKNSTNDLFDKEFVPVDIARI